VRQLNISFAGAGRVADALCRAFYEAGFRIAQVVSPSGQNGRDLAGKYGAVWSDKLIFSDNTDIIIVAVPDHLLSEVIENIQCETGTLIAHTAGSYGLEVFPPRFTGTGVFYPLQTFTKGRRITFRDLPVFIEASGNRPLDILKSICEKIEAKVYIADVERRRLLHLSAVFICNFTNHMIHAGFEIAQKAGFSFDVLMPLLTETIEKASELGPGRSQTGPAVRNDMNTIRKQMELLSFSPELQRVYGEVSESIINLNKNS